MKKSPAEATNAENLEEKFDRGEEVLDYFNVRAAKVIVPQKRSAGSAVTIKSKTAEKRAVVRDRSGVYGKTGSPKKGEFMDVKEGGKPFKGVAKEPDKRRK